MREGASPAGTDDVASPCVRVCIIDPASGYCRGCRRTLAEIAGWSSCSPDEKRNVLARIAQRAINLGTD